MKKYNMPAMEISLFDAEVVSTSSEGAMSAASAAMENFTQFQESIAAGNGISKTIGWNELEFIY